MNMLVQFERYQARNGGIVLVLEAGPTNIVETACYFPDGTYCGAHRHNPDGQSLGQPEWDIIEPLLQTS